MDNKYFAPPAKILTIQEDKLEGGTSFEKHKWPDVNDEKWVRGLYDYYDNHGQTDQKADRPYHSRKWITILG